ncbi:MAG: ATP-binding cassette domain-containing protein [Tissierellia bacterium]|nr:ATP-binding cassette domain-containing protein [Tissierellia bacterium]
MSIVSFSDVSKKFGSNVQLKNISFDIQEEEIVSLVGPYRSFKTTILRMIMNFIKPSSGSISVLDMDSVKNSKQIKEFTSYIPQETWLYDDMRPISIFKSTLSSHKLKNKDELYNLIDYFDIDMRGKIENMSFLNKKKISIVNALVSKPSLLLVDDISSINDIELKHKFYNLIEQKNKEGMTIVLATNNLHDAQSVSNKVIYLNQGEVLEIEDQDAKQSNDKILSFYDRDVNEALFDEIGAKLVRRDIQTVYYYNGDLNLLAKAIYEARLMDYSVEDSTLDDKLTVVSKEAALNESI